MLQHRYTSSVWTLHFSVGLQIAFYFSVRNVFVRWEKKIAHAPCLYAAWSHCTFEVNYLLGFVVGTSEQGGCGRMTCFIVDKNMVHCIDLGQEKEKRLWAPAPLGYWKTCNSKCSELWHK